MVAILPQQPPKCLPVAEGVLFLAPKNPNGKLFRELNIERRLHEPIEFSCGQPDE